MPALKKPFTLLLILSHLNAFVLGGVGNVYAANQEVNTVKSPQNFVDITANEVLNISSVQGFKFVQTKYSSKGFFSSSVNINTKATAKDAYSAYQQDLAQQQAQLQDLQAKLEDDIGFIEQIDIDEMSELVGDLQADKKYYQTNIALAASSLAAKTTALAAQLATAAASSGTYG
ncbi:hypothetical protein, partial [bacterium endosymbiont of Bathymodiolus sp. 5 South]